MTHQLTPSLVLTTDHSASSYGKPVLIHNPSITPETVFGPADVFEYAGQIWPAAKHVERFAALHKDDEDLQSAARSFCAQWPDGPQIP